MVGIAQVALCTSDLARTIRTYVEVLGFANGGGRPRWGRQASRVQELPTGEDTYLMMWWLVGRQDFVQLEFFQHSHPRQRPLPEDASPADLGWSRFGVTVRDFDASVTRLRRAGLATFTEPMVRDGARRVCFRDPGAGVVVEILEDDSVPSQDETENAGQPVVSYVAVSVADVASARDFFVGVFGFRELAPDTLHHPSDEELWGPGRCSSGQPRPRRGRHPAGDPAVQRPGSASPRGRRPAQRPGLHEHRDRLPRPRRPGTRPRLGSGRRATATTPAPESAGSVYVRWQDRLSLELLLVPPGRDAAFGFAYQELLPDSAYSLVRTTDYEMPRPSDVAAIPDAQLPHTGRNPC